MRAAFPRWLNYYGKFPILLNEEELQAERMTLPRLGRIVELLGRVEANATLRSLGLELVQEVFALLEEREEQRKLITKLTLSQTANGKGE